MAERLLATRHSKLGEQSFAEDNEEMVHRVYVVCVQVVYKRLLIRTYHDGYEMAVVVGQRSVAPQYELLCLEEVLQVGRVRGHHPGHVVQSVVLQEGIHEQHARL